MEIEEQIREVLKRNGITDSKVLMEELMKVVEDYGFEKYQDGCADERYAYSMDG